MNLCRYYPYGLQAYKEGKQYPHQQERKICIPAHLWSTSQISATDPIPNSVTTGVGTKSKVASYGGESMWLKVKTGKEIGKSQLSQGACIQIKGKQKFL